VVNVRTAIAGADFKAVDAGPLLGINLAFNRGLSRDFGFARVHRSNHQTTGLHTQM